MNDTTSLIKDYAANPINNYEMQDYTIMHEEGNAVCWDFMKVYIKIDNDKIGEFSFAWNSSMVATAAASIIAEQIAWKTLDDILTWNYDYLQSLGFEVSPRRKRAAVLVLVVLQNAIHKYRNDWKQTDFDDLIPDY